MASKVKSFSIMKRFTVQLEKSVSATSFAQASELLAESVFEDYVTPVKGAYVSEVDESQELSVNG